MEEKRQDSNLMTLGEINCAFNERLAEVQEESAGKSKSRISALCVFSDILFYLAIFIILYSVMSIDAGEGAPRDIAGYSSFTVLSSSMKDEIPKGSLIITRKTEPGRLQIGDNITFLKDSGITVTHKIIGIYEGEEEGERRFQTKGVNNANPDDYTVPGDDVLGKVVVVLPCVGAFIGSVIDNIHLVLIIFLLCSLFSFLIRGAVARANKRAEKRRQ